MMKQPLVDIIIPVYNVADYLDDCISSVVCQTYSNVRIILVDDGSTDNSGIMCDRYAAVDPRIEVIHQNNNGLSAARNSGVNCSNGDYITFIDSDDIVLKTYVEHLVHAAESASCDIAIGGFTKFTDGETPNTLYGSHLLNYAVLDCVEALNVLHDRTKGYSFTAWGKLYRRNFFDNSDIRFPVGRLHEDDFLTHKLVIAAKKVVFTETYDYCYRVRKTGIMGVKSQQSYQDAIEARRSRYAAYLKLRNLSLIAIGLHDVLVSCIQYWCYLNNTSSENITKNEVLALYKSLISDAPRSILKKRPKLRVLYAFPYMPALVSFLIERRGK